MYTLRYMCSWSLEQGGAEQVVQLAHLLGIPLVSGVGKVQTCMTKDKKLTPATPALVPDHQQASS